MNASRQLAAIMFADIMGYTALMEDDEVLALQFREKMKQKLETEVNLHKGKIIKWMGDGALCSFDSAIESVRAALALQIEMQQEPKVPIRIGIHQADVIFEESDVHGDGVNIASRLESLALPGSIFISAKVFDDIKNQKDIQAVSLGKYSLKNVKEPVEIFALSNAGLNVPLHKKLEGKGIRYVSKKLSIGKKALLIRLVLAILLLAIAGFIFIPPILKKQHARNELIPQIQKLSEDNFFPPTKAFELAQEAKKYIPKDSALINLWPKVASITSFHTEPEGASVYWKDYTDIIGEWKLIGKTPLEKIWMPKAFPRVKIEKEGYNTVYSPQVFYWPSRLNLKLIPVGKIPENMVYVKGGEASMMIVGLEQNAGKNVNDFLIDKYEVTSKEFKRFVDKGGYRDKKYWSHPFYYNGKELEWEKAMKLFHDKTGQPGPAGWEAGTYPDGKEDHPVTGISWYEAMAYAKFADKKLPTVYHWSLVANTMSTWDIIPKSNFNGEGTVAAGSLDGISFWGVYDIAGNAREWCLNEKINKEHRFILGGGWNDPTYGFNDGYSQPTFDRSLSNGFRCVKELPGDTTFNKLSGPVSFAFRDYYNEQPVTDETFKAFLRQFDYDRLPLQPKINLLRDSAYARIEKIEMKAAYDNEILTAYLYLPKNISPPYQTILFFPGSGDIHAKKFDINNFSYQQVFDFLLKNGRAVIYPVFKGTFERGDGLRSDLQEPTVFYKQHVIAWSQDIGRCLDYLDTREDIVKNEYGYFGLSWGSAMAPLMCAVEKRFKSSVLNVGGLMMQKTYPEVDIINFLTRMKLPTLMLNGKNDTFFPIETSQKPMFKLMGTDAKDKKMIEYEGGHLVPRSELIKETLRWFDKYLGPVK